MGAAPLFITGTDTGVGKTLVAAALLGAYATRGLKVAGMKPVASGALMTSVGLRSDDALALIGHATVVVPYAQVNPYCFEPAIAPHIAAAAADVRIEIESLRAAYMGLSRLAERTIVEGAGGWLTPLNESDTLADFAKAIEADVVLVVGMRLGCLNHAMLTAQAIALSGLNLAGWVANALEPAMPRLEENIQTLKARLGAPLLGVIPYHPDTSPARIAPLLSLPA